MRFYCRYPEDLPKWLVAALREIGFTEDRSAAETFDSQGVNGVWGRSGWLLPCKV